MPKNEALKLLYVDPASLADNPLNWRTHGPMQEAALDALIFGPDGVGWAGVLLVNERAPADGWPAGSVPTLIDGHDRRKLAMTHGEPVPAIFGRWTPDEEKTILATLDPIATLAGVNAGRLADLLGELNPTNESIKALLDNLAASAGVASPGQPPPEDAGPKLDKSDGLKEAWGVEPGQLWQAGKHLIYCGDSTTPEVAARLFTPGQAAALLLTDPPYGIDNASRNKFLNAVGGNRIETPMQNDDRDISASVEVWRAAFCEAAKVVKPGGALYVFSAQGGVYMLELMLALQAAGLDPLHELVWVKNNHVLGRLDYSNKHEPIIYGWKGGGAHNFYGGFSTSVLEYDRPAKQDMHPTTKPLELIEKLVINSSLPGELVFDPFVGSGTTLIACVRAGRVCRAADNDPRYVAVTLQRYTDTVGAEPVLVD